MRLQNFQKDILPDRFLPDKAIDLIDEAASSLRIEIDSMPEEIDTMLRQKIQLEIEREALKKELKAETVNSEVESKIKDISKQIDEFEKKIGVMKAQWTKEKSGYYRRSFAQRRNRTSKT